MSAGPLSSATFESSVRSITLTPDRRGLLLAAGDYTIKLIDLDSGIVSIWAGTLASRKGHVMFCAEVCIRQDGGNQMLLLCDGLSSLLRVTQYLLLVYVVNAGNSATNDITLEGYQRTVSIYDMAGVCATSMGDVYVLMNNEQVIKRIRPDGWTTIAAGFCE